MTNAKNLWAIALLTFGMVVGIPSATADSSEGTDEGNCTYNLWESTCDGGECTVNAFYSHCEGKCEVNMVESTCGPDGRCQYNIYDSTCDRDILPGQG